MRQTSFLTLAHAKKLRCERFLDETKAVVPWEQLTAIITPCYKEQDTGRKKKELNIMLKIYFLKPMVWTKRSRDGRSHIR